MPFITTSVGGDGSGAALPQDLGTTDTPTFSTVTLTSNGGTNNITIGDDVILGDGNVANHVVIIGQQDDTAGGIVLGTNETEFISTNGTDLSITADNDIVLYPGSNYAYLNVIDADHRLATMADVSSGTQGDPGPQGDPGADGADALWNFTGEYNGGASYAVGDIATYDGQLWYRYNSNGGNVGDTPSPGLWNLLAAKGADGADGADGTNGSNGADFGIYYLGNYISTNGYITDIAVVRGSDGQLYLAKASGQLGDPIDYLSNGQWEVWIPKGADGAQGEGIPTGGTTGQILAKVDSANYNTEWIDNFAESTVYLVRNNTASTILKGTLVSAVGAEPSGRIDVAPHETTGLQNSELRVMGMATTNITNGTNGTVMSFGTLTGLDTRGTSASAIAVGDETWAEGDILYAHPTADGKLTNVRPQHDLAVAFITVRHASSGQIAIRIVPGNNHLEWMHDVVLDSPADNEVLAFDSASGLWKNQTASEAGLQTDSGWQVVSSFSNGYSGNSVAYRKVNNIVYIRGNISGGTANTAAFTLPEGYRPSTIEHVVLVQKFGTMLGSYVTVGTDGQVTPMENAAWLSGISYPLG